ncbi:MAG: ATP-binding protein, partial [Pseudomonadota bacterium]
IFIDAVWQKSVNDYHEVAYHHPDGSLRRLAATTSYLLDVSEHESTFVGFVALFKDITEVWDLRLKERRLSEAKARIAKEKAQSLRKLAMGVAHEIINPVVSIGGFALRIFRDKENSDKTRHYAGNIVANSRRLEEMVQEIQHYCDLPSLNPIHCDIGDLLNVIAADAVPILAVKNIRLSIMNPAPSGFTAMLDPSLVKMGIIRIIENAVDFSEEAGDVALGFRSTEAGLVFEVRDSGPGISDQDLQFIFDPFFSTKTTADGMGLAIVERIAQEHLGYVEVESEPGKGTSMRLIIPHAEY